MNTTKLVKLQIITIDNNGQNKSSSIAMDDSMWNKKMYAIGRTLVFLKNSLYENLRQLWFKLQEDGQRIIAWTVLMKK